LKGSYRNFWSLSKGMTTVELLQVNSEKTMDGREEKDKSDDW
jgi:hypothetical protein